MSSPIEVHAEFTGQATAEQLPQPPSIEQLILDANAEVIAYINELQGKINSLGG